MSVRLQFTGDILCQIQQNDACRTETGYDYSPVLRDIRHHLADCDYLVGNLETPFAGKEMGYSDRLYQFNTPDEFLTMLKDSGFHMFSTANNHCMDRGTAGLDRTLNKLDDMGFAHTGTFRTLEERNTPLIEEIGGIRFGFISYTYGTNAFFHHMYLPEDRKWSVNLLQPEEGKEGAIDLLDEARITENVERLYRNPNFQFDTIIKPYLDQLAADIRDTRSAGAEYVILLLHCGGQHNLMPDAYTHWIAEYAARSGADMIIGNHQHILHPYVHIGHTRVAYCLGNLTDTPDSNPNGRGIGEEYSILLRVDFAKRNDAIAVEQVSFVPVKSVFDERNRAVVRDVESLIRNSRNDNEKEMLLKDLTHFVNLVSGTNSENIPVRSFYLLEQDE